MSVAARADAALVAPGPVRRYVAVRTGLTAVIGIRLAFRRWWALGSVPDALFEPAFAVRWLPAMPPAGVLVALQVGGVVAAVAGVAGRRPRAALAMAWAALVVLAGLWSSVGKVMHNDVLLLLASIPFLAAADPGAARAKDPDDGPEARAGWPPRAALAVVAVVYVVSGMQKLAHSGAAWVTGDNLRWVLLSGAHGARSPFPGLAADLAARAWATHVVAAGALAIELSAPVLLAFRRTRPLFVVLAAALHTGIWLTLGLDYAAWVLTVAVVAIPMALAGPGADGRPPIGDAVGP